MRERDSWFLILQATQHLIDEVDCLFAGTLFSACAGRFLDVERNTEAVERTVLRAAAAFENAQPWSHHRPTL